TGSILLVDTTPPTIGDVRVDPPEQAPGSPVNVSAAIADAVGLAATRIQVRDPSGTLLVDAPFAADPATGRFFYARTYAAVGPYAVLLIADDAAGNEARANASFTVALTPDVTPPTIASHRATPDPQEPFGTVRIEASVTDDRAVASVSVLVVSPSGADVENATMAFDSTVYHHEAAYGETGAYTYCLWAVDGAGNGARACGGFTIRDTTPPTMANVSAIPDPVELGGTVLVSARASDLVGVAAVTVAIRDPLGSLLGTFPMAVAGDVYTYAFAPAALGTFAYILTAADGSGNRATVAGAFLVRDTTPPAISAAASPDPQEIHVSVRFAAAVSDLDGVSSVAVEVRDPAGALLGPFAMAPDGPGRFAASRAFEDLGTYAFTVRAADPSGNAAAASGTFLVQDTTPPLAVAGPDVTVAFGDAVTFDGSASSDNDAIASYAWTFVDGPRDVALDGPVATYVFRNAGAVVVTLTVRDRAGNVASDGLVVTVTAPPSPGIAPPEAPRGLTATASSPTSLRLAWDPVTARTDGAPLTPAGYHVYRNATGSVLWEHITTTPVTGTTFVDAGLVRGIAYRYAVTALDAAGRESAPSVEASAVLPRPGGIRGVVADEASTPLPGAEVDLLRDGAMVATVRSADGRFAFPGVEPGPYTVRASRAGYASRDVPTLVDEGRWTELGAIRLAKTPVPPGPWWSFLAMPWFWVLVVAVALVGLAAESRRRLRRSRRERARRAKTRRTAAGGHQRTHFVSKGPKR
ncbi:MAG TPA: PKD domain-containing protein, partial [Thermoplasmata archaeon]|nr:PKD domain-containing protein [Thermoplasmata archaeon]